MRVKNYLTQSNYDSVRKRVISFGGLQSTTYFNDTWEWDGTSWVQQFPNNPPPVRGGHGMAYDSTRKRIVVFGGRDLTALKLNDT